MAAGRRKRRDETRKPSKTPHAPAVTRIRTEVAATTTQSTDHYTITAAQRPAPPPQTPTPFRPTPPAMFPMVRGWMAISPKKSKVAMAQQNSTMTSPSGNRTPVSRVTGGDTHHYTNEERLSMLRPGVTRLGRKRLRGNGGRLGAFREPSALPRPSGHGGRPHRGFPNYLRLATSCICVALSLNTRFTGRRGNTERNAVRPRGNWTWAVMGAQ
ncbi:uncharacterized protein LOC135294578 [Passer domesticus]|uniref:uncharacterized protein LOC135294578 n=1 Tax=Passer domesticus TaxID=48849 RepID=UPI0030FEC35C